MSTHSNNQTTLNITQWTLILISIICALPLIYISKYVHPINDDFSFALQHVTNGWFQSVVDSYCSWSGRYLATAISSANPYAISSSPLPMLRIYSLVLVILIYLTPVTASIILLKKKLGVTGAFSFGTLIFLIYMSLCPSVSELAYWFSSYTAFTIPNLLALLFFSILPKRRPIFIAIQALLALLIPGGNEVTAVLFVMTLAYLYYTYRCRRLLYLLTLSVIAITLVILSPGNGIRMTHQLSAHPYLWTICISIAQTISWMFIWLPALMISSLVYIPLFGLRISKSDIFSIKFRTFLIFSISAIFLAHVPPTYGLSSVVIGRTANSLLFFFIIFYFWGLNILLHKYKDSINIWGGNLTGSITRRLATYSTFCFIFILPLNINSPITTAITDIITFKAKTYSDIHDNRLHEARLHASLPDSILCLQPLGVTSKTLFVKDLDATPTEEFSTNYCKIYGLKGSVYVPPDEIFFESNFDALKNLGKHMR